MTYLFNLDSTPPSVAPGAPAVPALGLNTNTGIFAIYRSACGGTCDGNMGFAKFSAGAEALYGLNDPRSNHVVLLGNTHGVSASLSP